jgi:hypothetical protein
VGKKCKRLVEIEAMLLTGSELYRAGLKYGVHLRLGWVGRFNKCCSMYV